MQAHYNACDELSATSGLIAVPASLLAHLLGELSNKEARIAELERQNAEAWDLAQGFKQCADVLGEEHLATCKRAATLEAECDRLDADWARHCEQQKEHWVGQYVTLLSEMGQPVQPAPRYVPEVIRDQQEIIAQLRAEKERDEWKQAYARLLALVTTAPLTLGHMRALLFRLSLDGVTFGRPVPTGVWWRYVTDAEKKGAGTSINTYDEGLRVAASMGLYAVRHREPADEAGRPYHEDCLEPAKLEEVYQMLDAGQRLGEPPRTEVVAARRATKRRVEAAEEERRAQRERAEREVLLQKAYLLEQAQDQRDQAVAERDQAVQELAQASACHGCGSRIDAERWLCDGCRDREPQARPLDPGVGVGVGVPQSLGGLKPNIGFKRDVPNKPNIGFNPPQGSKEATTPTIRVAAPRGPASGAGFLERAARALGEGAAR